MAILILLTYMRMKLFVDSALLGLMNMDLRILA